MAKANTFSCSVITPERAVLECDAEFTAFPAHDGEMGVLHRRAPLICRLGIGVLRVHTSDEKHLMFVDGGFAQVAEDRVTILTAQARKAEEIDVAACEQALVEARATKTPDASAADARTRAVERAKVQLRFVGKQ